MNKVIILGGAGFIGSNLVKRFCNSGYSVTVIDAFFDQTGASINNIENYISRITLFNKRVEDVDDLVHILNEQDLIIDCMGWTAHHEAINNPKMDIELNLISHIAVINALRNSRNKSIIYLGSRGQYGNIHKSPIIEEDRMLPEDVQGINKLSAESFYRVYSKLYNFSVISLRLPNCFGENQITNYSDIGLIGGFIKRAIQNNTIEVYGKNRKRSILYVEDLVEIIDRLKEVTINGFMALNINGQFISISDLAKIIIEISNSGNLIIKPIPDEVNKIDMGNASLSDLKLGEVLPNIIYSDIKSSLEKTINYFKKKR